MVPSAKFSDHLAGISGSHTVRRYVVCDHTASPDDGAVADSYPRTYRDIAAKPAVGTDFNGVCRFYGLTPLQIVDWMLWGVQGAVGANQCVATDGDVCCIEKHGVVVHKHSFAKMQSVAVVAVERGKDGYGLEYTGNHVFQSFAIVVVVDARAVEAFACQS